jgi:hypothetical protein
MSIQQTLLKEIEDSKRWIEVEKDDLHTNEILKKELN